MYEGGGEYPLSPSASGGWVPPHAPSFCTCLPSPSCGTHDGAPQFPASVRQGGYPPLALIRSPPPPHAQGLGHTPLLPPPPMGGGGSYPPLCFVLCDGGLYVHSPRFLCKRGGYPPLPCHGGTPLSQKLMTPRPPPHKIFFKIGGVATPQGARVGVPPFHLLLSGITR